ncbi:MAG TPA: FkbM family methyltransferase [Terriglobia bacterium]|nr:FkbM family methyltransferase [Terriglobia bacterium]
MNTIEMSSALPRRRPSRAVALAASAGRTLIGKLRHAYRNQDPYWRELERLQRLARYTATTTDLLGQPILIVDAHSFLVMKMEIFDQHAYDFEAAGDNPFIIDCGANIGLAILYWKRLYPGARILAFEPDPKLFQLLQQNTGALPGVTLLPKAVWRESGELPFRSEGSWGGRVCLPDDEESFLVPGMRLRELLDQPIDLLKIDIEGAEYDVLRDCSDRLPNVGNLFVEYHSAPGSPQVLPELLLILRASGFRYHISGYNKDRPLVHRRPELNKSDLQLNISAYRV